MAAAGDVIGGMVERATDDVARTRKNVDGAKARFEERENAEKRRKVGEVRCFICGREAPTGSFAGISVGSYICGVLKYTM